jgi:hypothetical protein
MNLLHNARFESWALGVIERVQAGFRVEDSRVELKREWIDSAKAARRLAGHANASRGADILWLVGVDETSGVIGVVPEDLAQWWPGVQAGFDGVTPTMTDLILHVGGKTVCALMFSTVRAPYLVKNPQFGAAPGGSIAFEVPWREGTRVRSANRNDLLRILTSAATLPEVEILDGSLVGVSERDRTTKNVIGINVHLSARLYLTPSGDEPVVIPFHRCRCIVEGAEGEPLFDDFKVTMHRPSSFMGREGSRVDSATMERTSSELIAHGPGRCSLEATASLPAEIPEWLKAETLRISITLSVINAELPAHLKLIGSPAEREGPGQVARWTLSSTSG